MQTFVPVANLHASAMTLDNARLGKQRSESYQILHCLLKKRNGETVEGWANHPVVLMWEGHELALAEYTYAICDEWTMRGFKDTVKCKTQQLIEEYQLQFSIENRLLYRIHGVMPEWWGVEKVHRSHRSMLVKKNPIFYGTIFREDNFHYLGYIWPVIRDGELKYRMIIPEQKKVKSLNYGTGKGK